MVASHASHSLPALIASLQAGQDERVRLLLELNPQSAREQDAQGRNALFWAVDLQSRSGVLALAPHTPPSQVDQAGLTPLIWAAQQGWALIVQALLPHSQPDFKDPTGWTALMEAAARGHTACVRALVPVCDVDLESRFGKRAVDLAEEAGFLECADLIAAHSTIEEAHQLIDRHPLSSLPYCQARVERTALEEVLGRASRSPGPADSLLPMESTARRL